MKKKISLLFTIITIVLSVAAIGIIVYSFLEPASSTNMQFPIILMLASWILLLIKGFLEKQKELYFSLVPIIASLFALFLLAVR